MMNASWTEIWPCLMTAACTGIAAFQWAWAIAKHRGWCAGFEAHKQIMIKVYNADPMGWHLYAKEMEARQATLPPKKMSDGG